jgi:hypothetical protein
MRTLRATFLLLLAASSIPFLFGYGRAIYPMWDARSGVHSIYDFGLLIEPHVTVFRAYTHAHGERDGWSLFWVYDVPEGTRPVVYFPCWPFAVLALAALINGGFVLFDYHERRAA